MRHLVFQRRDAQRSFPAIRLRDVVPAHRRRVITAHFDPVQEAYQICLQFRLVVGCRHAVDAHRAILARPSIRFVHPVEVNQVMQGREHPLRVLPRLFGYPLLFRVRVCGTQGFLQRVPSVVLFR